MILTEKIKIKVNPSQIKHFRKEGVDLSVGEVVEIPVELLPKGSHLKIKCKCDVCGKEKENQYRRYLKSVNEGGYYVCGIKCAKEKIKKTNKDRYGVDYYVESSDFADKAKNTLLNNYGVTHYTKSKDYKDSINDIQTKRKKTLNEYYVIKENIISIDEINITGFCNDHKGEYIIDKKLYHNRKKLDIHPCTICYPRNENVSISEKELLSFIRKNYNGKIITSYRFGNKEIDIYLPEIKLGFEFNGLEWHSEKYKPNTYHKDKTDFFESNGVHLIHVWEDVWFLKKEIVQSRILNLLGKSKRLYARKCEIREIDSKTYKQFCIDNHIQGHCPTIIKLGLYHNDILVSIMGLGGLRKNLGHKSKEGVYELLRFSNKIGYSVVGGASKLLKFFIKNYNPKRIISYADRSWSTGNLYINLGFRLVGSTTPNYFYYKNKIRYNRYNFAKYKLLKDGYDPNKTEREIMVERGFYRVYDSGSLKYDMVF